MNDRHWYRPDWPMVACLAVGLIYPASGAYTGWAAAAVGNHRAVVDIGPGWLGLTAGPIRTATGATVGPRTGHPPTLRVRRLTAADRQALAFPQVYPAAGEYRFYCPLWLLTFAAGAFAAGLSVSRGRRAVAFGPGRCRSCGYDLRGSPARCPECGTAAPIP